MWEYAVCYEIMYNQLSHNACALLGQPRVMKNKGALHNFLETIVNTFMTVIAP